MSESKKKSTRNPGLSYYSLAMPPDLYEWYRKEAKRQFRSANSLFVAALQEYRIQQENRAAHGGPPFGD